MNYLLDTHAFVWSVISPKLITASTKKILNSDNNIWVSIISVWEISLKFSMKKLNLKGVLPEELPDYIEKSGFYLSNLSLDLVSAFYKLPKIKNKDPFDRMLAWQAIKQNMILISKDRDFDGYIKFGLRRVW